MPAPTRMQVLTAGSTRDVQIASSEVGVVAMLSVVVTGQPRVARLHKSRAPGVELRRPNPETRKVREQVCTRRAARTRFARVACMSRLPRWPRCRS
jgi:hypothetical protein